MISGGSSADTPDPAYVMTILTSQAALYSRAVSEALSCPACEMWALDLVLNGDLVFRDVAEGMSAGRVVLGIPERMFATWRGAVEAVIPLMGDPECHIVTGYHSDELLEGVARFFEELGE